MAIRTNAAVGAAPAEEGSPIPDLTNDLHRKRPVQASPGGAGTSSNPRHCTREEMEGQDTHHLKTYCSPYPATIFDLY